MIEIKSTTEYHLFKTFPCNRAISMKHVKNLANDPTFKDSQKYHPIVVNKDMMIIDGQHRLKAAEYLEIPIYYVVHPNATEKNIKSVNINMKYWESRDYLKHYTKLKNKEYEFIEQFTNLEIPLYLVAAVCAKFEGLHTHEYRKQFKDSTLQFKKKKEIKEFIEYFWPTIHQLKSFHGEKIRHVFSRYYFNAFTDLYINERELFDKLMNKLNAFILAIPECSSIILCKETLVNLANKRIIIKNPISKNEFKEQ